MSNSVTVSISLIGSLDGLNKLENIRLLNEIHNYDVLRVDRGISAWGLESRVPFLDHNFVDLFLSIDKSFRNPIKY